MEAALAGYTQTTYDVIMSESVVDPFNHGTTYRWKVEDLE